MADVKSSGERGGPTAPPYLDTPFTDSIMRGLGKGNYAGVEGPKVVIPALRKNK